MGLAVSVISAAARFNARASFGRPLLSQQTDDPTKALNPPHNGDHLWPLLFSRVVKSFRRTVLSV
jgi:hypothetical protein